MVSAKPGFRDCGESLVLCDLGRNEVAVIIEDRHILGMIEEKLLRAVFRPEEREYPIPVLCPAQAEADGKKNSKRKTTIVRLRQGMIRI